MGDPGRRRGNRVIDVLGAVATAFLAFLAVPVVLVVVVGNPLAGGLGHAWSGVSRDALCVVVVAAWVAWAACCAQLARGVAAHVRRGESGPPLGMSVLDRLAARIAVGIIAAGSVSVVAAPATLASATSVRAPVMATSTAGLGGRDGRVIHRSTDAVYVVQRGQSLARIALEQLDDAGDWTAIAAHNLGAEMGDGSRFVDPDHVRAGWRLRLPDTVRASDRRSHASAAPDRAGSLEARLPELAALGAGSLTCAALARRARNRRRHAARLTGPDLPLDSDPLVRISSGAIDAGALLARFDGIPALGAFEAANRLLARAVEEYGLSGVSVRMICVGPDGVTFWLRAPVDPAPRGFEILAGGAAWRVDHELLTEDQPGYPYVPVALPVGTDDDGTWMVALGPGDVLPVFGAGAESLWRAARAAQQSWAWADSVLVADSADDPRLAIAPAGMHVVYFGALASLPAPLVRRACVVTTHPVAGSDLSILVDREAATIHPTGRVVRPHLMSDTVARQVDELTVNDETTALTPPAGLVATAQTAAIDPESRIEADDPLQIDPGTVDVRLLTMTPRLDGLCEELPPNRARRAVELVAYLALHHPDVITSDRLRTRVLGSADADAAAKTLFNTAHAARRAMGLDEHGNPLFPAGSRTGLYHLSPAVTVDVQRAVALVDLARTCDEGDVAIASYRAALELVEGEPLANALSGYTWWEAEGHAGRIAAVLVEAACALVPLCVDRGLFDLARWGLGRGRIVAPYSEALSRAAMELAAAEGDSERLRTEWRECQRMVDALDPGCAPSQRTESLYAELSRRIRTPATVGSAGDQACDVLPAASDWTPAATP